MQEKLIMKIISKKFSKELVPKMSRGFGLLEVMISGAVIIIILGSLVLVAHAAINNNQYMQKRAEATFLAQEGLEMVRQIRDSNWIDRSASNCTSDCTSSNPQTNYGKTNWDSVQLYPESGFVNGKYIYNPSLFVDQGCYRKNKYFMTYPGLDDQQQQRRFSLQTLNDSINPNNINNCRKLIYPDNNASPSETNTEKISVYPNNMSFDGVPDPDPKRANKQDYEAPANVFFRVFFIERDLGDLLPDVSGDIHPEVNAYKVTVYIGFNFNGQNKIIESSEILTNWRPDF
jgi:type II secretory pathway pseudopilin PulG